ncbi:MAG TPA: 2-oxoglutarate and iron-dependent oxygenase domain-containing protein [Acidimicrobiales bacterium]|jgi:isopenicillin N synthase-like dioxygenase|nr:2-oxoglutarate and iron-dependent oxygenase domain-containing protein [Acidimicrobiales bacterium]
MRDFPIIDVAPLLTDGGDPSAAAAAIDAACRDAGFFYVVGHGVEEERQQELEAAARRFFALADDRKRAIAMERGGLAWRGWFAVGDELTSGIPDNKEGLYFGQELGVDDPRVQAGVPLHGPNLFPQEVPELRDAVLDHIASMTAVGHAVMRGVALALGLDRDWFESTITRDPVVLFRIFHYPPHPPEDDERWGVGEHSDYGLLTLLRQDDAGGLQVRGTDGWREAPPVPGSFVCNIGDMLERMTGGLYRSTPHRVRNTSGRSRLSFPFFFDPSWDAVIEPVPHVASRARADVTTPRWDGADLSTIEGTYGDYLVSKVSKVFPQLRQALLDD